LRKIRQLHLMLDSDISDGNLNGVLLESVDPIAVPQCRESLGHCFIQSLSRDFDCVSYPLKVLDRDAAGSDGHETQDSMFAFHSLDVNYTYYFYCVYKDVLPKIIQKVRQSGSSGPLLLTFSACLTRYFVFVVDRRILLIKLYFADGRERPSQGIAKVRIGGDT